MTPPENISSDFYAQATTLGGYTFSSMCTGSKKGGKDSALLTMSDGSVIVLKRKTMSDERAMLLFVFDHVKRAISASGHASDEKIFDTGMGGIDFHRPVPYGNVIDLSDLKKFRWLPNKVKTKIERNINHDLEEFRAQNVTGFTVSHLDVLSIERYIRYIVNELLGD